MAASDMYIKLVDPTGKHADVINHHRVWNRDRFYNAQVKIHENPNKDISERRLVSVVTEADYNAHRQVKK